VPAEMQLESEHGCVLRMQARQMLTTLLEISLYKDRRASDAQRLFIRG